jgi:Protein of unknown function (DUF2778)
MWIYIQRTGRLYKDYTLNLIDSGYSGHGVSRNNPGDQWKANRGPIPCGIYTIGALTDGPTTLSLPLEPDAGNEMFGRFGFYIHGEPITRPGSASHGCIVLKTSTRRRIAHSNDKSLVVRAELADTVQEDLAAVRRLFDWLINV